jgi:hypothetical protein
MPNDLKDKIAKKGRNNPKEVQLYGCNVESLSRTRRLMYVFFLSQLNTVWVSCEGENAADKEHIGTINMSPVFGFPGYYFPFSNIPGYVSPLVAVWFQNPKCKYFVGERHDATIVLISKKHKNSLLKDL